MTPHLYLAFPEEVAAENFDDFVQTVEAEGLRLKFEPHSLGRTFAGVELLMPAAFALYIAKSYFDGFLNEMGKEHYQALKRGIGLFCAKLAPVTATIIASTPGKVSADQPFSLIYAIMADAGEGHTFKFLLREELSADLRDREIECFLSFLASLHEGSIDEETVGRLGGTRVVGRTILLAYDPKSDRIVGVDPMNPSGKVVAETATQEVDRAQL